MAAIPKLWMIGESNFFGKNSIINSLVDEGTGERGLVKVVAKEFKGSLILDGRLSS